MTEDGNGTPEAGCLIVLNSHGVPVETWAGNGINGPWDMTVGQRVRAFAELFVTNVLNGTVAAAGNEVDHGTVLRLSVFDPPGRPPLLFARRDRDRLRRGAQLERARARPDRRRARPERHALRRRHGAQPDRRHPVRHEPLLPRAGRRLHRQPGWRLNAPLGLTLAPNGDLITVNGNDGNAVEVSPFGAQVDTVTIDPFDSGGDLFGLAIAPNGNGVLFVDDNGSANTLDLLH